jgi:ABC-2 type transport system permease protein
MVNRISNLAHVAGLDAGKQAALFRLRARLTWRQFMREPGQIVGLLGFLAIFAPVAVGLGIASALGYLFLSAPWPGEILAAALTLTWLIWILAPLLSYRLNEGLDMTRLMVFPLRRRDLMVANLAGTVFDLPSYLTLPIVAAIFVGWYALPMLPLLLAALIIWYAQLMLTSQMVLHATGGLLRSRRFRDLTIVIFSLFGMSCYFISQFVNYLTRELTAERIQSLSLLVYLQWTPPGAAARAIERGAAGDWAAALLWLLYAGLWLVPITWAWWRVTNLLLTGASLTWGAAAPARPAAATIRTRPFESPRRLALFNWIPLPIRQLARKELLQSWRVPQRRINMLQGLLMPLIFAIIWGVNPWASADAMALTPWAFLALPGYALLAAWAVTDNMLGWEGPGLHALLLTPVSRRMLLAGKALGLLLQITGTIALLGLTLGLVLQSWWVIPGWFAATGATLAGLVVTMPISVRFAHPVNLESTSRRASSTGGGCMTGLISGVIVPMGITLVNAPIAGLFALIYWQDLTWLIWPAGFLSLGYGLALFGLGLSFAARLLLTHEPELIEATSKPTN